MKKLVILFVLALAACSDEEIEATGDLVVRVNLPGLSNGATYVLQTEAAYLSGEPLYIKQGTINANSVVTFSRLLPGTYVFVVFAPNSLPFVAQVIPAEVVAIDAKL